ncbi:glycoside hydrolase family 3 protein [Alteromonas sp. ASW11-130]|uniref:glycoside hydrolase family 3 protein n=1 Tax=Alteromonas sp. ASW11-130 TaxID=3015775 RepID=UPI002241B01B|nr:glycoside hydrolase family 3 N-terminal domain-containing protein [Alteromonas sp. ASW11-130]MCW8093168.1 glycoside hydrolase family 3 C-terminal domain-containing protein [Alteromonas sp. ASW11-130]
MKKAILSLTLALTCSSVLTACNSSEPQESASPVSQKSVPDFWPDTSFKKANHDRVEKRVAALLETMTLEQKVAQVIQPEIRDITVEDMRKYGFGSYLNGGGAFPNNDKHATVQDWVALAEKMYQASVDDSLDGSTIPTMWGTDAVHGHNNVIGATLFPHNIGLGAMNDPSLITKIAEATSKEVKATGIDWIFAPTVAVARNDRWGRTYESYSENPEIVGAYAKAIVTGMQGDMSDGIIDEYHAISTVKHFLGDGGTEDGDDQGDNISTEKELFDIHAQGYVHGLAAGAQSVMASFNSWHGKKIHGSKYLLTDVLKNKMGFDGFVVGDWNGHGQIAGCTNEDCPQAMNAGLDIYMVPTNAWKPLYENVIAQVKSGQIAQERLDDAVRRILRVKVRAGLFEQPSPANRVLAGKEELIGAEEHRQLAREAVRKSLVMLKNKNSILPLSPKQRIGLTGDAAHNIGKQSGGWTITWQGTGNTNGDFPGGSSIYDGFKTQVEQAGGQVELAENGEFKQKPDVAVVVFGENPYAEGNGDISNLEYQRGEKTDLALLKKLQSMGIPVVSIFITGRPLWVNPELNASDAFVVAWLPGSEGSGVADVLLKNQRGEVNYAMTGKLPFSWPADPSQDELNLGDGNEPLFPFGYGLTFEDKDNLSNDLNETIKNLNDASLSEQPIYVLSTQKPWQLEIRAEGQSRIMNSNTASLNGINVRTTDRNVQEDSLFMTWESAGSIGFYTPFSEDMRSFNMPQGAIVFDIKGSSIDGTQASISCLEECATEVNLAHFANDTVEWQEVVIPLHCFTDGGVNLGAVQSAFALERSTPGSLTLSNLRYTQYEGELPSCQ